MKINVGDFGYRTPEGGVTPPVGPEAFVNTRGMQELGQAGMNLGREMALSAAEEEQRKRAAAEAEARRSDRTKATASYLAFKNDAYDLSNGLLDRLKKGDLTREQTPVEFDRGMKELRNQHLAAVPGELQGDAGNHMDSYVFAQRHVLQDGLLQHRRDEVIAATGQMREELERQATRSVDDLHAAQRMWATHVEHVLVPELGHAKAQEIGQAFNERTTFNFLTRQLNDAVTSNDPHLVHDAVDLINHRDFGDVDPAKKNILLNQANHFFDQLENKAAAAENRRLALLSRTGSQMDQRIAMGIAIPPEEMAAFRDAAKGTPFEPDAERLIEDQRTMDDVLKRSPADQVNYLNELHQQVIAGKADPRTFNRVKSTVTSTIKLLNENPIQYLNERAGGTYQDLNLADVTSWDGNLQARAQGIAGLQRQVGGPARGVLKPQEVAAIGQLLDTGTPAAQKAVLEPIRRGINDDEIFRATVQQFAKDAPTVALAATIMTKEAPMIGGRLWSRQPFSNGDTASLMLEGRRLRNPTRGQKADDGKGSFPFPSGDERKDMLNKFNGAVGDAFAGAPMTRQVALEGAEEVYAGLLGRRGDYSGALDSSAWREAIQRTLNVGKFNGSTIIMPWGMDEATFKDKIQEGIPKALEKAGLPFEDRLGEVAPLSTYTLVNVTGSSYVLRQARHGTEEGGSYLTGPKGRVVIQIPEAPSTYLSPAEKARRYVPN